jgi:hypothetical protein
MTAQQKTPLAGGAGSAAFDGEVITEVPKNQREVYRVMARTFKGYRLADIRVWFDDPDIGELRPGKGVSIKVDALPAIVEALAGLVEGSKP